MGIGSGLRDFWQGLSASARQAPASRASSAQPGTAGHFGRYEVEAELGRGAMGAVYRARDPQSGQTVAIKTIAWGGESDPGSLAEARARFLLEVQTSRRLNHPDIVALLETGEERGLAYLVMSFASGVSLDAYTGADQLLPLAEVLRIGSRVAEALAYAHQQGVLHRDVKPANVMIDRDSGSVKITDFGIARLLDAARTRSGMLLGTPAFMAPELLLGRPATPQSDLYALGVTLFQLLTGRLPHESASMAQLMRAIVNEPAPDLHTLRPDLGEALANVIALALERRPELRYADAGSLAQDLHELIHAVSSAGPTAPAG